MSATEVKVEYNPQELEAQIVAALTSAQLARITEYCNMPEVTTVTVSAEYGPPAQIYISNSLVQGAAKTLPEDSELAKILRNRART